MFNLLDQDVNLMYLTPTGSKPIRAARNVNFEDDYFNIWDQAIKNNPDTIFFLVTMTTDVFDDEEWMSTHSCSCHARNQGPCEVCEALGCEVWDFNQIAMPPLMSHEEPLPSEDTHDIYAQTTVWDGKDKPLYNCSEEHDGTFEVLMGNEGDFINVMAEWNKPNIYFFGPKKARG